MPFLELDRNGIEEFSKALSRDFSSEEEKPKREINDNDILITITKLDWGSEDAKDLKKWGFVYRGHKISASIKDDEFCHRVNGGERFAKGDKLKVNLSYDEVYDKDSKDYLIDKSSYKILNVLEHQQLSDLWKGFADRRSNEGWRKALDESIYWYLNANHSSRGIDAGIILTQAAIERLSYEFAVEDKLLLTAKGFKDLWASDKFRLLFFSLGISIDIPAETPELQKLAKQFSWVDAPHALTEVRNSLVHPDHKHRGQFDPVFREAWNLGLWYLEMGILAICNYKGTYGNRLKMGRWVGDIDNVPY